MVPERSKTESALFPSLFVSLSLKIKDHMPRSVMSYKVVPYDLYCPSIQSSITERVCKICNIYFASIVMLRSYLAQRKRGNIQPIQRIRPTRIAACRQRVMKVILSHQENEESVDWVHMEELDLNGVEIISSSDETGGVHGFPVVSVEEHLKSMYSLGGICW